MVLSEQKANNEHQQFTDVFERGLINDDKFRHSNIYVSSGLEMINFFSNQNQITFWFKIGNKKEGRE